MFHPLWCLDAQRKGMVIEMNERVIYDYLRSKGMNAYGASGLLGNLYAESALNPKNLQNSSEKKLGLSDDEYTKRVDDGRYQNFVHDSAGYGLAQWTYWSRKQNLLNFAKSRGASIGDLQMQLDFLMKEIQTGYPTMLATLQTASSVLEASNSVLLNFERPADQSEKVQKLRASYGQKYYDEFVKADPAAGIGAVERVLGVAKAEEGYLEKASNKNLDDKTANVGSNNYTKYARDLDSIGYFNGKKNGYAWCASFVAWCFVNAFGMETAQTLLCHPARGDGASCTMGRLYYREAGRYYKSGPKAGDQIFFTKDNGKNCNHTGLVTKVENGTVYTIEGNTSSAVGVVDNGGCVRAKSYPLTYAKIDGYGRPRYELIAEEDDNMDVNRFAELYEEYRKTLQDNDCGSWSKKAREWAVESGLIAGGGTLPDGTPNYMWADTLTREQAAQLFYRFAKMAGLV